MTVELGPRRLASFLAEFHPVLQQGRVAKVPKQVDVFGIGWTDQARRTASMVREVRCLTHFAGPLEPAVEQVTLPDGKVIDAITMWDIPQNAFIAPHLRAGHSYPPEMYVALARKVARFHADVDACPVVANKKLDEVLFSRIQMQLLDLVNYHAEEGAFYQKVSAHVSHLIHQHRELLQNQSVRLGHCDIKTSNIAALTMQCPVILDPAPNVDWQITHPRVDAMQLAVDLLAYQTPATTAAAKLYWETYNGLSQRGRVNGQVESGIQQDRIIDTFAQIRHLLLVIQNTLGGSESQSSKKVEWALLMLKRICNDGKLLFDD